MISLLHGQRVKVIATTHKGKEGKILSPHESLKNYFIVELDKGGKVAFSAKQLTRIGTYM